MKTLTEQPDVQSMIPLTPAIFHIMLALADGARHGYAVMLEIERLTGGQIHLGAGTLYRSIQRMLLDGFIEESVVPYDVDSDDERRRYYRLTELGQQVARAEARRLAVLVEAATGRGLLTETSPRKVKKSKAK